MTWLASLALKHSEPSQLNCELKKYFHGIESNLYAFWTPINWAIFGEQTIILSSTVEPRKSGMFGHQKIQQFVGFSIFKKYKFVMSTSAGLSTILLYYVNRTQLPFSIGTWPAWVLR